MAPSTLSRPQPSPAIGRAGPRPHRPAPACLLAALLLLAGCQSTASPAPEDDPAAPAEDAADSAAEPVREGPWRVECFSEDRLVFEHNRIYRVWHPEGRPPYWAYETPDGLRFRGRMGTDLNCTWQRL
jgi:hypothetical protein